MQLANMPDFDPLQDNGRTCPVLTGNEYLFRWMNGCASIRAGKFRNVPQVDDQTLTKMTSWAKVLRGSLPAAARIPAEASRLPQEARPERAMDARMAGGVHA